MRSVSSSGVTNSGNSSSLRQQVHERDSTASLTNRRASHRSNRRDPVDDHRRLRPVHQFQAHRPGHRDAGVGQFDDLGRAADVDLDRQARSAAAASRVVAAWPLVERRDQEPRVRPGGPDLRRGGEHRREVRRHLLVPRTGQERDDRPALPPLLRQERRVELLRGEFVEVRVADVVRPHCRERYQSSSNGSAVSTAVQRLRTLRTRSRRHAQSCGGTK